MPSPRSPILLLSGVIMGVALAITGRALADWNARVPGQSRPDSEVLERMVRAQEESARRLADLVRAQVESTHALRDGARAETEVSRAIGELRSRCH